MHWQMKVIVTCGPSYEPIDQAPKDLETAKSTSSVPMDFFVLKHGQSWAKLEK